MRSRNVNVEEQDVHKHLGMVATICSLEKKKEKGLWRCHAVPEMVLCI